MYVVDTGVYIDHEEFEGRARWGKTVPQNDEDIDGNGHGTHCAGTIASKKVSITVVLPLTPPPSNISIVWCREECEYRCC